MNCGFMQILLGKAELQFHAPTISAKSSKVEVGREKLSRLPSDQHRVAFWKDFGSWSNLTLQLSDNEVFTATSKMLNAFSSFLPLPGWTEFAFFFFPLLPGDPAVCLFPLLLYQLKDKTCFCFHKDFLLKCRCQKYGPRGTTVELRMIIEGGDYFSFSIEHSESSLWLSGWGKHKNPELRGVGTEKKCCFHFKTLLCIWSFSKWVLSRAILNILGILGGRPDQALLYFILIFFSNDGSFICIWMQTVFQFCDFPQKEWFQRNGSLQSAKKIRKLRGEHGLERGGKMYL